MRNWNFWKVFSANLVKFIFTLPMRNWNKHTKDMLVIKNTLFLLYLWGIETFLVTALTSSSFLNFYFTYEELKPVEMNLIIYIIIYFYFTYEELKQTLLTIFQSFFVIFTLPMRNWNSQNLLFLKPRHKNFYFTYEELKLYWVKLQEAYKSHFYFTYEELKQEAHKSLLTGFSIFTLPMRNWNTHFLPSCAVNVTHFYFTYEELKPWQIRI